MNFEIEIALKKLALKKVLYCLNGFNIDRVEVIDNWNYDNQESLQTVDTDVLDIYLKSGRIVQVYGKICQSRNCGMFLYIKEDKYICDFWFDCSNIKFMDSGCVDDKNRSYYTRAINFILTNFIDMEIYYATLGCELLLSEDCDILSKIQNSHNSVAWIIKDKICSEKLVGFYKEYFREYLILMKC